MTLLEGLSYHLFGRSEYRRLTWFWAEQCISVSTVRNWTLGRIVQTAGSLAAGFLLYSSRHLAADVSMSSLGFSVFCSLVHNKVPFRFPIPFVHNFIFIAQRPPSRPGPPHYQGFTLALRHTTLGRTPLDE